MKTLIACLCFLGTASIQVEAQPICMRRPMPFDIFAWSQLSNGFESLKSNNYTDALIQFSEILDKSSEHLNEETLPIFITSIVGSIIAIDSLDLSDEFYKLIGKMVIDLGYAFATEMEDDFDGDDCDIDDELDIAGIIESKINVTKDQLHDMASSCKSLELQKILFLILDQ